MPARQTAVIEHTPGVPNDPWPSQRRCFAIGGSKPRQVRHRRAALCDPSGSQDRHRWFCRSRGTDAPGTPGLPLGSGTLPRQRVGPASGAAKSLHWRSRSGSFDSRLSLPGCSLSDHRRQPDHRRIVSGSRLWRKNIGHRILHVARPLDGVSAPSISRMQATRTELRKRPCFMTKARSLQR